MSRDAGEIFQCHVMQVNFFRVLKYFSKSCTFWESNLHQATVWYHMTVRLLEIILVQLAYVLQNWNVFSGSGDFYKQNLIHFLFK